MTIEKVLLQTTLCALDFKANLEALDVPARLIENASGNPSRYVILDSTNLTTEQRVRLTRLFFMTVFILVMKLSDKGEYGFGIVILATAVCSLLWPITVSYFLINWIVDLTLRVAKK